MKRINEEVRGKIKIIENEHNVNGNVFKIYIVKKLTRNGIWREYRRFNGKTMQEAFERI